MAGTPTKSGSRIAMVAVIIPILLVAYFVSPLFLPRWRWENMRDMEGLAIQLKQPAAKLKQTYEVVARYSPRGEGDPVPWQILQSNPLYDPENDEGEHKMVRVTLISDRTGEPPSKLRLGSGNYRDVFFKGTVWRFPPGAFGFNRFRPVVVFDGSAFDKMESREAFTWDGEMKETAKWTNDDTDIKDGFKVPGAPEE